MLEAWTLMAWWRPSKGQPDDKSAAKRLSGYAAAGVRLIVKGFLEFISQANFSDGISPHLAFSALISTEFI